MGQINWNSFKVKNNKKESDAFQDMCYLLFCAEFNNRIGLFRYKNQIGLETEPQEKNGELYGFQSKYYKENSTIRENKSDIIDSINKAKQKNPDLKYFYLYVNKELSESSEKNKKEPKYQKEIENAAKEKGFSLIWRVPSEIELQLYLPENHYIYEIFFEQAPTEADLLDEIKSHNELILQDIREDICFNDIKIKFDRSETIKNIYSNLMDNKNIVISGEGGSGKTAVLKELCSLYLGNFPVCIFKASELNVNNINHVFDFGSKFSLTQFGDCFADEKKKFFVIDSAEKLSELQNADIIKDLLSFLRKEKWVVLFTVRCSYLPDLEFQLQENFNLSYEIQKIDNLSSDELFKTLSENSITAPKNDKLKDLIKNLFYLNAYVKYCQSIDVNMSLEEFYDTLWEKKIKNSSVTKDDIHIQREEIFLQITKQRCEKGKFFISTKDYPPKITAALKQDEILEYDKTHNGVFITHDIYEEWGLDRIISVAFENHITPEQFFSEIGTSLPIRRAFRSWLQNQLLDASASIKNFIKEIFLDENVEQFWKDELLIAVMLSDYAHSFFNSFEALFIDNDFDLLKRCLFLLRIACTEVKSFLEDKIYKPVGRGWESVISLISKHREDFFINNFRMVLPIFKCWALNTKDGETTKQCGLLLLNLLEKSESEKSFYLQDENEVFETISNCAKEIKTELETIFSKLLNSEISRGSIYYRFADKVLSDSIKYVGIIVTIPHIILKLCNLLWTIKRHDSFVDMSFLIDMETAYGIEKNWSYNYASSYKTPIYWLLHVSFKKTVDFIVDFTNKSVEHYKKSDYGNDVEEVVLNINNTTIKQYLSWSIWSMFRGNGSPVVPGLLQSIHMALEKVLLEFANNPENRNNLKKVLISILLKSKSASLSAVVCSIVLAHPQDFYEIALILFRTIQFFHVDLRRQSSERKIKCLYRMATEEFYAKERLATCEDKFRNQTLESLFLQYQYWGIKDFSEEQNTEFLRSLYDIIDEHKTHFSQDSVSNDKYKILLARFDRRNLRANVVEQKDDSVRIGFVPIQLDERLQNISNETNKNMENMNKYASLFQWADFLEIDNKNHDDDIQYNREPLKALSEVKSLMSELNSGKMENLFIFYCSITIYVCSKLIVYYKDRLTEDDKKYCNNIIMSAVDSVFSGKYGYQIHDGVEAAAHAIPYLMSEFPNDKIEYIKKIVLLLFDTTSIGEYKRVCDYALESIISAKLWDTDYAAAKLILFYYLRLRTEICKLAKTLKKGKYHIDELVSEKLDNISIYGQDDSLEPEINNLSLEDYDILLQLIPSDTEDKFLLNLYKIIVVKVAVLIFQQDSEITNNYRLKANIFKSCSHFILNHKDEILIYLQPLLDNFALTEGVADFLDSLICAQSKINKKDAFWTVWNAMYPKIKSMTPAFNSYCTEKIFISYLLAWRWWGEEEKEWNGLSVENKCFYDKVSRELCHLPVTLYSISRVLNTIGTCFFDEGIFWLHNIISAKKFNKLGELENVTISYLERYMRKFIYDKKQIIKKDPRLQNIVINVLTYMINLASAYAYILRESIL